MSTPHRAATSVGRARSRGEGGQLLVLFVLSLLAMIAMSALLFDAAQALVLRRQLQDAGDAAAIAASNTIQTGTSKGCSATKGPPPGSPRSEIVTAAQNAVQAQMPGIPTSAIHVSCPSGWSNYAVEVDVDGQSPAFFGPAIGFNGFGVHTTSQAVNGQVSGLKYSVVLLDPSNLSWPNGRRGCPSMLISGGPTITFDGSVMIDSTCTPTNGGALATNGNSATLTFNNSATMRMVGGYAAGPLTISPAPTTGATAVVDPLKSALTNAMASYSGAVQSSSKLTFGGSSIVLHPGTYVGGIQLKNTAKAFLEPGVYYIQGGGFDIGAQNEVYSVAAGVTTTDTSHWATDCPTTSCGIVIYNTGTASGAGAMGQVTIGAGATLKLRPYLPSADSSTGAIQALSNLLIWQDASPAPSSTYAQPIVQLSGGGTVDLSGSVYAPSAAVSLNGGSGGSGGSSTDVTLQFIAWDITFSGNSTFHFFYQSDAFAKPSDYGLIK